MQKDEIMREIRDFIAGEFPMPGLELTGDTDLLEEWFVDSLGIVETVMFLERRFGVQLQRADINGVNFRNVTALAELVRARLDG